MKILLVNLPWFENGYSGVRAGSRWPHIKCSTEKDYLPFPFYLAYSAALLKQHNFNTTLLDCIALSMTIPEFLSYVKKNSFDVVVAETSAPSRHNDLKILNELSTNIKIILCGPDIEIINNLDSLVKFPFIHAMINGEYEQSLLKLIYSFNNKIDIKTIPGIIYRNNTIIYRTSEKADLSNVNDLPLPMRHNMPMKKYIDAPGGMPLPNAQIWASRGCPFNCCFCAWPQIMGKAGLYRPRNVDDVLDEMHYLADTLKFKSIYFDDDTFNVGKERMIEFCEKLIKRRSKGEINIPWAIMARADLMSEELLNLFKKAGLYAVKYGVESANQNILDLANKNMELNKTIKMIKYTKNCGIKIHLTFIFGLPGETRETIQNTTDLALSLSPDSLQFSLATPFPGTKLFNLLKDENCLTTFNPNDLDGNHTAVIKSSELKPLDLIKAKDHAYKKWDEFCHLRRNPQTISINNWHIKRARLFYKNYGFKPLLAKTYDYLKYLFFHNCQIKMHHYRTIALSKIRMTLVSSDLRLFYKEKEISRGPGFQSSFRINEKRFDTSLCDSKVNRTRLNEIYIEFDFRTQDLPIKQIWWIELSDSNKIKWNVEWFSESEFYVYDFKFSLMVSDLYKFYFNEDFCFEFPVIEDWQNFNFPQHSLFIGLKSSELPQMKMFFKSDFKKHIQNTSRFECGRMIHALNIEKQKIKPGRWHVFSGLLILSDETIIS